MIDSFLIFITAMVVGIGAGTGMGIGIKLTDTIIKKYEKGIWKV